MLVLMTVLIAVITMFISKILMAVIVNMNLLYQARPISHIVIINADMTDDEYIELEEADNDLPSDWEDDDTDSVVC